MRRVLLTGASSGIGAELARELAARGDRLAIAARRRDRLEALAAELTPPAVVFEADLARRGEAARLGEEAVAALGGVDVLVNNAGGGVGGRIATVGDRDEAREAFEVNYWSALALVRSVVPAMVERGGGVVVNVTSVAQVNTWPGFGAYAATKAALAVATETLRLELIGTGVHVLEAAPGPVDTAVQGETRLAPGIDAMLDRVPLGDARECARAIVRGIDRRRAQVVYPKRAAVALHAPTLARWDTRRIARKVVGSLDPEVRAGLEGLVVRTGSRGDEVAVAARERWEQERGRV